MLGNEKFRGNGPCRVVFPPKMPQTRNVNRMPPKSGEYKGERMNDEGELNGPRGRPVQSRHGACSPISREDGRQGGIHTYAWTSSCHACTLSRSDHSGVPPGCVFRRSSSGHLHWLDGCDPWELPCRPLQSRWARICEEPAPDWGCSRFETGMKHSRTGCQPKWIPVPCGPQGCGGARPWGATGTLRLPS